MEARCITKMAIVEEQHIRQSACSFPRSQIVLLATKTDLILTNLRYQNRFDKPHRSAGATQAAPLGKERHLLMESHHDGDETKGSVYSFVQDYMEAQEASRSVRTAGPTRKDLTVMLPVSHSDNRDQQLP